MSNTVKVTDMATGSQDLTYVGITPREAVIAAHAQKMGDWNTWEYEGKYGPLVKEGKRTIRCGDFTAPKGKQ